MRNLGSIKFPDKQDGDHEEIWWFYSACDDALMKTYSKKKKLPKLADTLHEMFTSEKLTKRKKKNW
jgi:hypothetical protein